MADEFARVMSVACEGESPSPANQIFLSGEETMWKAIIVILLVALFGPLIFTIMGQLFEWLGVACTWLGRVLDWIGFSGIF